ncbi:hypothetical protein BB561_001426 [Smittium simulii]|uniref:Dynein light intermediate chain n=1 Tax=Smittium simulii TaxID=133385 RepID=A0A2T9YUP1_9FUNG|nr:hypothetical protein BB561_001426 [Smittium simulii]
MVSVATAQPIPINSFTDSKVSDIWQKVLCDSQTKKTIKPKNLLILGDEDCGKSTIVANLFRSASRPAFGNDLERKSNVNPSDELVNFNQTEEARLLIEASKSDIGLSYIPLDIKDEENEDTISRIGVYQIDSDLAGDRELLKNTFDYNKYSETAALIVLDWSNPARFVKALYRWFNVLSEIVDNIKSTPQGNAKYILESDQLENYFQTYKEPIENNIDENGFSFANAALHSNILLPLEAGTLESNLGIPIIIVCTKSDQMAQLERDQKLNDEDFDYIQQILRSICLHYGAALFYTSLSQPSTYDGLYHYIVHRLLSKKPLTVHANNDISNDNADAHDDLDMGTKDIQMKARAELEDKESRNLEALLTLPNYPFRLAAQVIDRDLVRVPSGWDTRAKIQFLRDGFNVEKVQKVWSFDILKYKKYVHKLLELYANPASNLRYNLDRIINTAQEFSEEALKENKEYKDYLKENEQQDKSISLNNLFLNTINSGYLSGSTKYEYNTLEKMKSMGNDIGVSFENENEFFQRLYEEQCAHPDLSDYSENPSRRTRTLAHLSNIPASFDITQSRYENSENSLSTAQEPIEADKMKIEEGSSDKNVLFNDYTSSKSQTPNLEQDRESSNNLQHKNLYNMEGRELLNERWGQNTEQRQQRSISMNVKSGESNTDGIRTVSLTTGVDRLGIYQQNEIMEQPETSNETGEANDNNSDSGIEKEETRQKALTNFFVGLLNKKKAPVAAASNGAPNSSITESSTTSKLESQDQEANM